MIDSIIDTSNIKPGERYRITNLCEHNVELPMPSYPDSIAKDKRLTRAQLQLGTKLDKDKEGAVPHEVTVTGADVLLLLKRPMFVAMCTGGIAGNGLGREPLVRVNYGPSQLLRRK